MPDKEDKNKEKRSLKQGERIHQDYNIFKGNNYINLSIIFTNNQNVESALVAQ